MSVKLAAEVSGYKRGIKDAEKSTKDFSTTLGEAAKRGKLDAVADQAGRVGLALAGMAAGVATVRARFDKEMSSVAAATHASAGEMDRLRDAAIEAGAKTSFSATEAAQGVEELAKAGVSTADILSGGLSGALDLAAAGEIGVGEAAETAASAMTQFKLKGQDLPHVADLLAAGAGKAQGSVQDMSAALNQSGLVAAQMGLSIDEATGTLAAFASAGLLGSDSGTSFKTMLLRLAAPTDVAAAKMKELGIEAFDSSGKFVGMAKFAGNLQSALAGLTDEQRNAALSIIFGQDAIRSSSIVYQQGERGIQGWIDKTNDAGFAAETARLKLDNLSGDIEALKGSLETLAIRSGGANEGLRILTQAATGLVNQIADLPPGLGTAVTALAGVSGGALLLAAGWIKARRATADALDELRKTGPTGVRVAGALQRTTVWAGRATVAFIALEAASALLHKIQSDLNPQVDALAKGLAKWGSGAALSGEAARVLGDDMDDLNQGFKFLADTDNNRRKVVRWGQDLLETVVPGLDGTDRSLARTRERVQAFDAALSQLVQGGAAEQARVTFERFAAQQAAQGVSMDEVRRMFPQYAAALETAGTAADKAKGQMQPVAGTIDGVGGSAEDAAKKVDDLKEAFDRLFGIKIDVERATLAYKQGIADLAKEFKGASDQIVENKKKSGEWNQVARDQRGAILDQVEAIKDLRDAEIAQNGDIVKGNANYDKRLVALGKQLISAGANKEAVWDLINAYRNVPKEAETEITAKNAVPEKKKVEDFNFVIRKLPNGKVVTFTAKTAAAYDAAEKLRKYLRNIPDETINLALRVTGSKNASAAAAAIRKQYASAHGNVINTQTGLVEMAAGGIATSPTVLFGERETGREMYLPQRGISEERAMSLLQTGASWYGARVVQQSAAPAPVTVQVFVGDREITDIVDVRISENNRDVRRRALAGVTR